MPIPLCGISLMHCSNCGLYHCWWCQWV